MRVLKLYYDRNPIRFILFVAFLIRLCSVLFSKGFGMHDDHFLVIEAGQSFADGFDYNNWLPWNNSGIPSGHSWFYVGIHFLLFKVLNFIRVDDPQLKMLVVRFLHAIYSLLIIFLSYRITKKLGTEKDAIRVAWLLALFWFIPSTSVRNLVEWVCVPPLLFSIYFLQRAEENPVIKKYFIWTGIFAGVALSIRFQTMFFFVGMGIYLLWKREFKGSMLILIGFIFSFFITQAVDLFFLRSTFC